jgi:hypothetical protein
MVGHTKDFGVTDGKHRPLDNFPGSRVTTHCIKGYSHLNYLGDVNADDFFTLVISAGRTDAVGHLRAFALGANGKRLGLDFPVRAAFIAALT